VRLRPGGFLPARLVTAGDGFGAADGEAEGDADGGDEPPRVAPDRPEETRLSGAVAGSDPRPAAPARPAPVASAEPPPLWPPHGTNDAPGPPSKPTNITIRHAPSTPPAHIPASRIRRTRRPDGSLNTGRLRVGGLARPWAGGRGRPRPGGPGSGPWRARIPSGPGATGRAWEGGPG